MRKPFIAGNWKMHGSMSFATQLIQDIIANLSALPHHEQIDVAVLPTFVHLALAKTLLAQSHVELGAQDLYLGASGAFTGEVAGPMLADAGCRYVLVGHSERRTLFHETDQLVAEKFVATQDAGLTPILCIGETENERAQNKTDEVIYTQLTTVIERAGIAAFKRAVIAYEPVWAIGTGLTATPDQAQTVHAAIRHLLKQQANTENNLDLAKTIRILYGGSMKAENAAQLLSMPDIDGGLIGGAALQADSFVAICQAAV